METKPNESDDSLITPVEKAILDEVLHNDPLSRDEINLKRAELDDVDGDGDLLNELSSADDVTGEDLDIPGSKADDADEAIGAEDEENNGYSEADTE